MYSFHMGENILSSKYQLGICIEDSSQQDYECTRVPNLRKKFCPLELWVGVSSIGHSAWVQECFSHGFQIHLGRTVYQDTFFLCFSTVT